MGPLFNVAHRFLDGNAASRGDKIAVYCEQETISYRDLTRSANRFGNLLRSLGLSPRERIVIALPDSCEFLYAFLGSIKYGAWPVAVSAGLTPEEHEFILQDCQASLLVTSAESAASQLAPGGGIQKLLVSLSAGRGWLDGSSPELNPYPSREEDIAFMLYSSGSTGKPKGVPHRHGDMPFTAETFGRQVLAASSDDIFFSASKLPFAYGLGNSISLPFSIGASVVLFPGKCTPDRVLGLIEAYRPSLFFAVPTLYNLLLRAMEGDVAFQSLRLAVSAGEALPASTCRAWKTRTGVELLDGIGSTEALHIFISNRPGDVRPGSSGRLIPPFEARVVDDADRPVAAGQSGHLLIRGRSTAPGYWNRPEKTQETMLEDGWLRTGDIYVEEDGYYTYQGRGDDMFKVEAQWLSPIRVEEALRDHPAVLECAVTSRKLEGLVRPVAYVVPVAGVETGLATARDLLRHAAAKLPAWMCPVQVVFCGEIPKTSTGKVQRFRLRQEASGDAFSTDR